MQEPTMRARLAKKFENHIARDGVLRVHGELVAAFIEEELQAERGRMTKEVRNLWQHSPANGIPALMAAGTLISRKEVLDILNPSSQ